MSTALLTRRQKAELLRVNLSRNQKKLPKHFSGKLSIVAQKIKELNGGNAWDAKEVKKAIGIGDNNKAYYYTASSRDFGITAGTSQSKEISLTELGREIVYAPDPASERKKKIEAFLNIDIFKKVLDYYKGSTLPEMKYLSNTLENQFKLHPEYHEEFSQLFSENCKYLEITTGNPLDEESDTVNGEKQAPSTIIVGEAKKAQKES